METPSLFLTSLVLQFYEIQLIFLSLIAELSKHIFTFLDHSARKALSATSRQARFLIKCQGYNFEQSIYPEPPNWWKRVEWNSDDSQNSNKRNCAIDEDAEIIPRQYSQPRKVHRWTVRPRVIIPLPGDKYLWRLVELVTHFEYVSPFHSPLTLAIPNLL